MAVDEPTVPNVMVLPFTVPWMDTVPPRLDTLIVPRSVDPDCRQVSRKVPVYAPPYRPDQVPVSADVLAGEVVVGGGVAATAPAVADRAVAAGAVAGEAGGLALVLHAASAAAPAVITRTLARGTSGLLSGALTVSTIRGRLRPG